MNKDIKDLDFYRIEKIKDVIFVTYKKDLKIDISTANDIVKNRLNISQGKSYPLLVKDEGMKSVDKEARDFFASSEGVQGVKAAAFIANTIYNKMLINFFFKVNVYKPKVPTRIFTDMNKALEWLEQYKKNKKEQE